MSFVDSPIMVRTEKKRTLLRDYGALLGEQYAMPIKFNDELTASTSCSSNNTLGTAECDALFLLEEQDSRQPTTFLDRWFQFLGFELNPMQERNDANESTKHPDTADNKRNSAAADLRLSMLSNFSTAYNTVSISLALQMMKHVYVHHSPSDSSVCSSALIAGMIVGQVTCGTLGDLLGRHLAMAVVMLLQVVSAFGSAFSCRYYGFSVYQVLAVWRFLLGLGCGGVYPLAATLTTESSQSGRDRAKLVALTFSLQGVGYLVVPMVAYLIVSILGETSDLGWRILLGLGSVPGAVLTIGRCTSSRKSLVHKKSATTNNETTPLQLLSTTSNEESVHMPPKGRSGRVHIMDAIGLERDLVRKLLGTAGSWLLFDILFYGNTLFQPVVLSAAFGSSETVSKASRDTFIIALMALPGYYFTVFAVGRQSPRYIQLQGFFAMGVLYLIIGILFKMLSRHWIALLAVYGSTFLFSNYGPNATTFMLPSMTFSKSCRSTLNGLCAASGKAGALIGATVFVSASRAYGQQAVFFFCSILSFAGCFLTLFGVSEDVGQGEADEDDLSSLDDSQEASNRPHMRMVYSHPSIFDLNNGP